MMNKMSSITFPDGSSYEVTDDKARKDITELNNNANNLQGAIEDVQTQIDYNADRITDLRRKIDFKNLSGSSMDILDTSLYTSYLTVINTNPGVQNIPTADLDWSYAMGFVVKRGLNIWIILYSYPNGKKHRVAKNFYSASTGSGWIGWTIEG